MNKDNTKLGATVVDLGFSYHPAQPVKINTGRGNKKNKTAVGRQLTINNIEELKKLTIHGVME